MSSFCPTCANMLHIPGGDEMFFCCKSCPYRHPIQTEVRYPLKLQTKKVDDILGGAEAWDNVDKIQSMFFFALSFTFHSHLSFFPFNILIFSLNLGYTAHYSIYDQ